MAAGQGTRFGGQKQYEALGGRRVLDWSLAAARSVAQAVAELLAARRRPVRDVWLAEDLDPAPVLDQIVERAGATPLSGSGGPW